MLRAERDLPTFEGGSLIPVTTYLLLITVLSGFAVVFSDGASPIAGMGWGIFLVILAIGAFTVEGVSPRSILSPVRSLLSALLVVTVFWVLYNLVAYGFALDGVSGFEVSGSKVAAHPLMYLAAFVSSVLFTAIPEELVFRGYLQSKFVSLAGGKTGKAVAVGVGITAILFALFHLPRWFLMSGHGVGAALATRLLGLTLMGLAYGLVYALTRNLWLVALFHATMNQPPFLVGVHIPDGFHLLVGVVEFAAIVTVVFVATRLTGSDGLALTSA
ncbi:putative protease of the Abi (CAAX) family protein [Halogeometricum borinquense DSM 11551]|uniref:Predicted protease of the Abi (CAAX) family n=1 Tax=Halogeometricum borinquense (strain ATCC 700274 / DSM 11551 / JCM 10706 / KCTC 4070 / PR3) TaxID=469382 RepID=E4NUU0_HALBP|nr:CPBP family intramembrane glutamic endopeptidase [Halogeometricum borinquense]ADQ68810.1 predicted protease of the Abi (CAAX) family [Halogeometricum borinquense DSM 11551]ELY25628.1 putative protease of the Abi (CAAX) family protein [Halogeometricum borinquense DSM 11551]